MVYCNDSDKFLDWLAEYAGKRIVFDVGCGDAHILRALLDRKVRAIGVDPFWGDSEAFDPLLPVLPFSAEEARILKQIKDSLVLFCWPCHGGFVGRTIETLPESSEVLYISKPENVDVDIPPECSVIQLKTPPCPKERVYQVTRNGSVNAKRGRRAA